MKLLKLIVILGAVFAPIVTSASIEERRTDKAAGMVCSSNAECIDVVSMQLDGMYFMGLNERDKVSIGALINRKAKALSSFCSHAEDKDVCENYKNQLMLKYITGLLDR
ncbi:valyl tRNA synthetase modifier [Acinetobacter phage vB_AbaM_PhT2-v2]